MWRDVAWWFTIGTHEVSRETRGGFGRTMPVVEEFFIGLLTGAGEAARLRVNGAKRAAIRLGAYGPVDQRRVKLQNQLCFRGLHERIKLTFGKFPNPWAIQEVWNSLPSDGPNAPFSLETFARDSGRFVASMALGHLIHSALMFSVPTMGLSATHPRLALPPPVAAVLRSSAQLREPLVSTCMFLLDLQGNFAAVWEDENAPKRGGAFGLSARRRT